LVYGNQTADQMICQEEIHAIGESMDFKQVLVLSRPHDHFIGHKGRISEEILAQVFHVDDRGEWEYYLCGPPLMVEATQKILRKMHIPKSRINYEKLSF
jgi:NAD(P)H-flavin reductase